MRVCVPPVCIAGFYSAAAPDFAEQTKTVLAGFGEVKSTYCEIAYPEGTLDSQTACNELWQTLHGECLIEQDSSPPPRLL